MIDTEELRAYAEVVLEQRRLERELRRVKDARDAMKQPIMDAFSAAGVQRMTIDDKTIYLRRQIWAGADEGDYVSACAALRAAGLEEYVHERFNTNSVSALFREWDREDKAPPIELADGIKIEERYDLLVRSE